VFLDPSHAYVEGFPSIPADGMLATFSRTRAIAREDIRFLSADHALVQDAIDLLLESPAGTTAFGAIEADAPNLLVEAVYVLEPVADPRWHVDQFLASTPVRVLVDVRGTDLSAERSAKEISADFQETDIHRFLERPGFDGAMLKAMLEQAGDHATARAQATKNAALKAADTVLTAGVQRLLDLRKLNDHVRPEEVALAQERLARTREAITGARLRLDAIRLIVEGELDE
jgi:ATP-dependent helicase HepA